MKCPFCGCTESQVLDSRATEEKIRRRRVCAQCKSRFTTYEVVDHYPVMVIKKDKTREEFSREKLLTAFRRACVKRDIPYPALEKLVDEIEETILISKEKEITSQRIGEMAMQKLRSLDDVAYVRFVSVYKEFTDIETFRKELELLSEEKE